MRATKSPLSALLAGIVVMGSTLFAGCQTYDFEPVDPLAIAQTTVEDVIKAKRSKPNVMLLVDTSGSMTDPVNPSSALCKLPSGATCGGKDTPCDTSKCPTRWSDLQAAMGPFLANSGKLLRFGLTTYPVPPPDSTSSPTAAESCAAATAVSVRKDLPASGEDDDSLLAHASTINTLIQSIPNSGAGMPAGGTPTSGSLTFVSGLASFNAADKDDRDQFVILLTDGLPNCNFNNAIEGPSTECRCTFENPSQCSGSYRKAGCLDMDASVQAARALRKDKGIRTIVIGFGAETNNGAGTEVLNAVSDAGEFARFQPCAVATEQTDCGAGDTCDPSTRFCRRHFYQAGNQQELAAALEAISNKLVIQDPCLFKMKSYEIPENPKLIVVYVNDKSVPSGADTWELTADGVSFKGSTCEQLKASRPEAPVTVEVRAIRKH
ncbi:adventurous gliding motility lipoprotein CglB [Myxococcaceae bacterium JPH2]|nr:adventurous gliding motility lipoprotein CglB [Myxococcaceae bacterium JPH2]